MVNISIPTKELLEVMKNDYCEQSAMNELYMDINRDEASHSVSPSQLYHYANGSIAYPDNEIEDMLQERPGARAVFRRMVKQCAQYYSGETLAASDGGLVPRKGKGFAIRFEASQSESNRYYMIIELDDKKELVNNNLFVFDTDNTCHQFTLPAARRGIIQLLVPEDGLLIELMKDIKTEVMVG